MLACLGKRIEAIDCARAADIRQTQDSKDGDAVDQQTADRLCGLIEKLVARLTPAESEAEDDDLDGDVNPDYTASARVNNRETQPVLENFTPFRATETSASSGGRTGVTGNVNPVTASDARTALQHLREVKPILAMSGDRKAIDSYNRAVKAIKEQIALGNRFNPRRSAYDGTTSRRRGEAADFETRAARFHGREIKLHGPVNALEDPHRAEDASRHEESFDEAVERVRREQIEKFTPKRRR